MVITVLCQSFLLERTENHEEESLLFDNSADTEFNNVTETMVFLALIEDETSDA